MNDLLDRDAAVAATKAFLAFQGPLPDAPALMTMSAGSGVTMDVMAVCEDAGFAVLRSQLGRLANRRAAMAASAAALPTAIVIEDNGVEPPEELFALVDDMSRHPRHPSRIIVLTTGDVARFEGPPRHATRLLSAAA